MQVKLSMAEKKLEEAYAELGKAAYHHFCNEESTADAVAPIMTKNSEINLMNGGSLSAAYT